ncbi:asparagine synthase (glutamine-hydrolyzing) [Micromonospora ureilytica]|uniref:asparagine synthase (glutamine-hydrolyzing) n=1 Tax=Micromonospora ureilytica TaxID=709868 RepID=UPI0033D9F55B
MCGFIGFVVRDRESEYTELAASMLGAIRHRGPDGATVVQHGQLVLGHCALSFTDRTSGNQPFVTRSGRTAVVFNGEIYNFRELRAELGASGLALRTGSDTEVLAEVFEREGPAVFTRIRGMYAVVAHDTTTGRTTLARDPLGKKPLYYFQDHGNVVFASELSALLRHPGCPGELDASAVADYLVLGAFPAPGSVLREVHKVEPGSYLEVVDRQWRQTIYWRPTLPSQRDRRSVAAGENGLGTVLRAAIARRVETTDDRLGVMLSGGLDSSVVAALTRELTGTAPVSFSIGFTDAAFDETDAATLVAQHLGSEHHYLRLTGADLADGFHRWYGRVDEPLADPSLLPTALAFELAGAHVRGVQTGDGADEVLLGYRIFQAERVLEMVEALPAPVTRRLPGLLRRLPVRHGNLPASAVARQLGHALGAPAERRFYLSTAPFRPPALRQILATETASDPFRHLDEVVAAHPWTKSLERSQLGMITHFLRDVILTKLDRSSMLSSVEARSPFLDEAVLDYCADLPVRLKLRGFTGKFLLRRLAARMLPPAIAFGVKQGFRAPIGTLLSNELRPLLLDTLAPSRLDRHGLFRPHTVAALTAEHVAGRADHSRALWALLCFQTWHDSVFAPATAGRLAMPVHSWRSPS